MSVPLFYFQTFITPLSSDLADFFVAESVNRGLQVEPHLSNKKIFSGIYWYLLEVNRKCNPKKSQIQNTLFYAELFIFCMYGSKLYLRKDYRSRPILFACLISYLAKHDRDIRRNYWLVWRIWWYHNAPRTTCWVYPLKGLISNKKKISNVNKLSNFDC